MDLRSTLNLPDPNFTIPMKADLPKLEPSIQTRWKDEKIYHRIQEIRRNAPLFVLHDGPPYTNSPIHLGTALNKVLKDFVLRSRTLMGFRTPYVPGFDNHGLPIEQAVVKKFAEKKQTPTGDELRKACRAHATEFIEIQSAQFQRLGVLGLWERPYLTMDFRYEANLVRVFKRLVEKGYVYKGLRPTLWSPTSRTALADTEIVYHNDHVSKAIYVRFPLLSDPNRIMEKFENVYTIIWTTTPWTIPSNLAVAFHPQFQYAVVRVEGSPEQEAATYVVLDDLVPKLADVLLWCDYEVIERFDGITLEGASFRHPIFDRPSITVMAEYVTTEDGTGVVHTAPSHGRDDFYTGQKYGLPVPNTVDERGVLTDEAGEFSGIYFKDCDTVVVDRLREVGALLDVRDFVHSYPYAERDDKPVIFRATEQWFVGIDHDGLRARMLEQIESIDQETAEASQVPGVNWTPKAGFNRIESMVRNRPDWCISRQRPWGVGIPVFYGAKSRVPILDPVAIEAVAELVAKEGSGAWFDRDPSEILPMGYVHPETGETEFTKETDSLDVWFDSGSSSLSVLEGNLYPEWEECWPADLYLEGSDQHRGWFNTSLILGTALQGRAPYRQVLTHGFVTDGEGRKMSKRLGNIIDPVKACDTYGADVLRMWVAGVDYTNDVPCTEQILKQFGEHYRTIRNTLKFLLGNLQDFDVALAEETPSNELDEWVIEQTDLLVDDCLNNYRKFDFGSVLNSILNFCTKEVSRFYSDAAKDRLYCGEVEERKSAQIASYYVLLKLLKLCSPVIPHTTEETWSKLRQNGLVLDGDPETVHALVLLPPDSDRLLEIEGSALQVRFSTLRGVRDDVFAEFEKWKGTDGVKDSQDVVINLVESAEVVKSLEAFGPFELANLFKASAVELSVGEPSVTFGRSDYLKCERSRLRRPDVELVHYQGEEVALTKRDRAVLGV